MAISHRTQAVVTEIKNEWAGKEIYPMILSYGHGRASVSAGIRYALKENIIECIGVDGTGQGKVYKLTEQYNHSTASEGEVIH